MSVYWLAKICCNILLIDICISVTTRQTNQLCWAVLFSGRECIIWCDKLLNKASMLEPCKCNHRQLTNSYINITSFIIFGRNPLNDLWAFHNSTECLPKQILSIIYLFDKPCFIIRKLIVLLLGQEHKCINYMPVALFLILFYYSK